MITKILKSFISVTSLIALLTLFSVTFLWQYPLILNLLCLVYSGVTLYLFKSRSGFFYFLLFGLLGAGSEVLVVQFGAWKYANPDFLGIPFWLILIWGIAGIYIVKTFEKIQKIKQKHRAQVSES